MGLKALSVCLLFAACRWTYGQVCYQTIPTSCDTISSPPPAPSLHQISGQQGPPGKRGPLGPAGLPGPRGEKGECDNDFVAILERKLDELEQKLVRKFASPESCYAGMKYGFITDDQIQASSYNRDNDFPGKGNKYHPSQARLDLPNGYGWTHRYNSMSNSWIEVDLKAPKTVYGIILQGSCCADEWITSYRVLYGIDRERLTYILNERGLTKEFSGNHDRHTHVITTFSHSIQARFVRISPRYWHGWPAVRFEILSC